MPGKERKSVRQPATKFGHLQKKLGRVKPAKKMVKKK